MESKAVLGLVLMLLLTCALAFAVNVQPAKTSETATAQIQKEVGTLSEAGPPIQWNKTYGGTGHDWVWSMVRTSDGGYALAGQTNSFGAGGIDFWLVKTDGDGNMQWSRTYGVASYNDVAYSVIQTSDGGYALVGTSGSPTNVLLVKTDSSGNMQWSRIYGGSDYDYAYSVIQTRDGGYAIAGATKVSSSQTAFWLFKTDSSGDMQWSHTYGGAYADYAHSVIQTSDGGYALVGNTQSSSTAYTDVWLIKTDSYGNVLWDKKYDFGGNNYGYCVIQTSDGGYAIAGSTQVSGIPEYEMLLFKTDSNGNVQWMGKYVISYYDRACSVIQTSDGGYAIAGYYTSENAYYGALKKIYANGTEQWERRLWDGAIVSVVQTADGGYALGGSTNKYSAGDYDFWLIKVASETPKVDWWPMFGHDARRTGASISTAPNTNGTLWTFEVYTTHVGHPVAADGIVFIGPDSPNDKIYALNATTGELLWNVTVGGGSSSFAVSGGTVYVSNQGSHKLYAFNEFTGNLLWSFTTTGNPESPLISEGMVFFSTWWEGKIYALNASTGSLLWSWQTPAGTKAIAGPAVADGMVFFSSAFDGVVYCFDEFTGTPKWNFTHGAYSDNTAAVVDGIVFIGGGSSGVFYALNETNGQLIWSYSTGADLHTSPSIHNGKVFFGANNGKVYALNASTGSLLWSYQTGDVVCGPVIYADGKVFFTSRDRKVYALNESTGSLIWSYDTSRRTDPGIPIVANGILYVPTGVWYESAQISYLIAFGSVPTGYFKLTITSTTGGTTSPSGIKIYPGGSNVNVQALPNTGYYLDHWELDGANIGSSNPITITMNSNHNLHAVFMQIPYDVTINAHCNTEGVDISVPITMDGSPTGYTTPHTFTGLTGTHTFTVPNTDPSGHPFKQWSTGSTSTTITVSTAGTYTAYYQAAVTYYSLTISTSTGGTTNPSPGTYSYQAGTVVTVTAIPNGNYKLDHWELDGNNIGSANPISITMDTNHNLHAVFIYSPPPGVGGIVIPVDKFALLAPYIGLASTVTVAAVATVIYVKRVKRGKEKQ